MKPNHQTTKKILLGLLLAFAMLSTVKTGFSQSQLYTVVVGDSAILFVTGANGAIQWQQCEDSLTWVNIPGATANMQTIIVTASATGKRFFRATITNALLCENSSWYSDVIRQKVLTTTTQVAIGDWFHGGIVFYINGAGSGLIAPKQDQVSLQDSCPLTPGGIKWGCPTISLPGDTSSTNGAANTAAILVACTERPIAASVCDTLNLNGYTDWFLPAKNQLNYLYLQRAVVGGFVTGGGGPPASYWSSTENFSTMAWQQSMLPMSSPNPGPKSFCNHVRSIRSFSPTDILEKNYCIANTTQPLMVNIINQPTSQVKCLGSNVTFSVSTTGTTTISYVWKKNGTPIIGATSSSYTINGLSLLDEGIYTCEATNLCRTDTSDNAVLKVIDITVDAGSDKTICHGQNAQLQATGSTNHITESGPLHYSWNPSTDLSNPGIANPVASPGVNTIYTVTLTDSLGCYEIDSLHVVVGNVFQNEQICEVSVDTMINKNVVVWEKTPNEGTDTFYVYKKGFGGIYNLIGAIPYDSMSVFVDSSSNPGAHSDWYKISVVDTCSNESAQSPYHKTMHLTANQGAQIGQHNLIWEVYEGFTFNYYRIYRGITPASLALLDSVIAGTTTYSDTAIITGNVYYLVQIVKANSCIATSGAKDQTETYNTSVSNMEEYQISSVEENRTDLFELNAYPNPFENSISISYKLFERTKVNIEIYNVLQEKVAVVVNSTQVPGNYKIEFLNRENKLANGVYYIRAMFNNNSMIRKVVKL